MPYQDLLYFTCMKYFKFIFFHLFFISYTSGLWAQRPDSTGALADFSDSIICYIETPLTKAQPECTSGNLLADNILAVAKSLDKSVQAAVLNQATIGKDYISPGAFTNGMLDELLPYNNKLVILEVQGDVLVLLCNHIAEKGGWPVGGITFSISEKKAINILVDGQPVNENIVYKIAANDYIAYGKDGCDFFKQCSKRNTRLSIKKILEQRLRKMHQDGYKLTVQLGGRIVYL